MGGRFPKSANDGNGNVANDVATVFDVFTTGQTFEPASTFPEDGGTFPGAIENIQARFENDEDQVVNIINPIPNLDLITRFVDATNGNPDQIEYTIDISNNETLQSALNSRLGFTEFTLVIEDASPDAGFQIDANNDSFDVETEDFQISDSQARNEALNDIEFIVNGPTGDFDTSSLLAGITRIRVNDFATPAVNGQSRGFLPEPEPGKAIIQAEDLKLKTYLVEDFSAIKTGDGTKTADAQGISLQNASGITGTASLNVGDFSIAPGTYDLTLSVFDENDGKAQLEVLLNGSTVSAAGNPIILNENTTSRFPTEDVRREFVIKGIEITGTSDEISIVGTVDGNEFARVDYLGFTEVVDI